MKKNINFGGFIVIIIVGLFVIPVFQARSQTSSLINLTGKVTAVDAPNNFFIAQIISATSNDKTVATLPPKGSVKILASTGTTFDSTGKAMPLDQVQAKMVFAATGVLTDPKNKVYTANSVVFSSKSIPTITLNPGCMKSEAKKRDDAILSAFGLYAGAIKSALEIRSTSEQSAWDNLDKKGRNQEFKRLIKIYSDTVRNAKKTMKTARANAWSGYKEGIKACNETPPPGVNSGADEQL